VWTVPPTARALGKRKRNHHFQIGLTDLEHIELEWEFRKCTAKMTGDALASYGTKSHIHHFWRYFLPQI
jgi:hypothetical protein